MKFIHVIALGDGTVPYVDETGRPHRGRAMGRAADGTPTAERVADSTYVRRAIGRSELAEAEAETPAEPVVEMPSAPVETSRAVTTDTPLVIQRGISGDDRINRTETDR